MDHLLRVMEATGCRVIMDHHALRDPGFSTRFERLWSTGRVVTAAAHLGVETAPLEARRRMLWSTVRKAPAAARAPGARISRTPRTFAKRGNAE
jgi:predicted metallo-beta-lactamase superfamily hydrolase